MTQFTVAARVLCYHFVMQILQITDPHLYGDVWAVEVEWPDGTLERVITYKDYSSAASWVATQSEAWLHFSKVQKITNELRQRHSTE